MCSFLTLLSYICPPLSPFVPPLSPFALFRRSVTKLNVCRASLAFCPLVPLVPRIFNLFFSGSASLPPHHRKKAAAISNSNLSSFGARVRASPQPNRERIRQKENYPIPA